MEPERTMFRAKLPTIAVLVIVVSPVLASTKACVNLVSGMIFGAFISATRFVGMPCNVSREKKYFGFLTARTQVSRSCPDDTNSGWANETLIFMRYSSKDSIFQVKSSKAGSSMRFVSCFRNSTSKAFSS